MRKTTTVTITEEGRDRGKSFLLTEMPASRAEKWALRALLLAAQSGADVPEAVRGAGMAGLAVLGIQSVIGGVRFADAEPLLDEMMGCVQSVPDARRPDVVRVLIEDDIEEVATRVRLRAEVFALHVNFSIGELLQNSAPKTPSQDSPSTGTSPG